jgi:hypothetical protein
MRWWRRAKSTDASNRELTGGPRRLDLPIYLDAGVALSLSASLGHGLVWESNVERAVSDGRTASLGARAGVPEGVSLKAELGGSRSIAVTESEVRQQTQESIFNTVRGALEDASLIATPGVWAEFDWQIGNFVDFRSERIVVPLVSVLSRLRVIADSVAFATSELSTESLEKRIPQLLEQMRSGEDGEIDDPSLPDDHPAVDTMLSWLKEVGEVASAISGVVNRLEQEADTSGLVDVIMLERRAETPQIIIVASLDRDYVDTRLLRRLGQSNFGVLGKVIRTPESTTAFNAFRNSMLGATNQLPVLLSRLTTRFQEIPQLLGDSVYLGDVEDNVLFDFVGSASAVAEMSPIWICPSVELFPIAIYA